MTPREKQAHEIFDRLDAMSMEFDAQTLAACLTHRAGGIWSSLRRLGRETPEACAEIATFFKDAVESNAGPIPRVLAINGDTTGTKQ